MKTNDINPEYSSNLDMVKSIISKRGNSGLGDSGLVDLKSPEFRVTTNPGLQRNSSNSEYIRSY